MVQEKDFSLGRQSLADQRREMIPALRDLYLETYSNRKRQFAVIGYS
ncbi:MAG: hypothetical protein GY731_00010 [Gammaproteobacteria bacterium]|nr:hypothetical protein [Gammaproteobacteria bacterium]